MTVYTLIPDLAYKGQPVYAAGPDPVPVPPPPVPAGVPTELFKWDAGTAFEIDMTVHFVGATEVRNGVGACVYYDTSASQSVDVLTAACNVLLAEFINIYGALWPFFNFPGVGSLPMNGGCKTAENPTGKLFNIVVRDKNAQGYYAEHQNQNSGGDILLYPAMLTPDNSGYSDPKLLMYLVAAELSECFMGFIPGLVVGGDTFAAGEGLSLAMAAELSGYEQGEANTWLNSPRIDQISSVNPPNGEPANSQAMLFWFYLRSLGHSWEEILKASLMAPNLGSLYTTLTGQDRGVGYADFTGKLAAKYPVGTPAAAPMNPFL